MVRIRDGSPHSLIEKGVLEDFDEEALILKHEDGSVQLIYLRDIARIMITAESALKEEA